MKSTLCLLVPFVLLACDVSVSLSPCGMTETRLDFSPRVAGGELVRVQLVGDRISQECTATLATGHVECRGSGPTPELLIEESGLYSVSIVGQAHAKLAVAVELDGAPLVDELVAFEPARDTCNGDTVSTATATVTLQREMGSGGVGGVGGQE